MDFILGFLVGGIVVGLMRDSKRKENDKKAVEKWLKDSVGVPISTTIATDVLGDWGKKKFAPER